MIHSTPKWRPPEELDELAHYAHQLGYKMVVMPFYKDGLGHEVLFQDQLDVRWHWKQAFYRDERDLRQVWREFLRWALQ